MSTLISDTFAISVSLITVVPCHTHSHPPQSHSFPIPFTKMPISNFSVPALIQSTHRNLLHLITSISSGPVDALHLPASRTSIGIKVIIHLSIKLIRGLGLGAASVASAAGTTATSAGATAARFEVLVAGGGLGLILFGFAGESFS